LERRPGLMPVLKAIVARAIPVAIVGCRNGDDLDGPAFLSAVGHRLAHAARDMASDGGRIGEKSAEEAQKGAPQRPIL
jgi:hypothetical protein